VAAVLYEAMNELMDAVVTAAADVATVGVAQRVATAAAAVEARQPGPCPPSSAPAAGDVAEMEEREAALDEEAEREAAHAAAALRTGQAGGAVDGREVRCCIGRWPGREDVAPSGRMSLVQ
jgi:hypothetical protein